MNILVLGLGNLILGDEGVGVHVAHALINEGLREEVTVLDVGTSIIDFIPELEKADYIIVVDAVKADKAPGSIYRIPYSDCLKPTCIASVHGFDLSRVLAISHRTDIPEVIVIGVEPLKIDWGVELSDELKKSFPLVIQAVKDEIDQYFKTKEKITLPIK